MSLKSSEKLLLKHPYSTGIFLCNSSSCCQACFPPTVRPMNRLWKMTLKIFFHSPMHLLWMTKKICYFLRYFIIGERIFPWFNVNPIPSPNKEYSWLKADKFSSLWFCFCLWSACKNLLHSVLMHILRADLLEFLLLCSSNSSETYLIHEKFSLNCDYCLFEDQILISTPYVPCK